MHAAPDDRWASRPLPIGSVLTELRRSRRISQLRLAELLCAASGSPTVTRHEVSRWERGERVPGPYWLGWLAAVLETPTATLAAATTPADHRVPDAATDPYRLWRPPGTAELLAMLDGAGADELQALAHAWLAGRAAPVDRRAYGAPARTGPTGVGLSELDTMRRMDDLVGGADLAARVSQRLQAMLADLPNGGAPSGDDLRRIAGWAQLAGWVCADGGDSRRAGNAYRVALRAATGCGDRPLAAHILSGISALWLATGRISDALLLARTAYAGARGRASARQRSLLLQREALVCAVAGEHRVAETKLVAAERAAERARPGREPGWLYWLDEAELTAMTGRCLAALGRPLRAAPLLARPRPNPGPRTAALDGSWLARAYLDLGEVERACEVAADSWRDTVRSGSTRVADVLRQLHPRLLRHEGVPAVRGYEQLATVMARYLPVSAVAGQWRQGAASR